MLLKIIELTLPIFAIALVGFFYGRVVRPDLGGSSKLVVDIALPVLILTSLSTKDFQPAQAGWFSLASVVPILLSGALAYAALPEATELLAQPAEEEADSLAAGIHLIAVQSADDTLVVGDSHHTFDSPEPFADEAVDRPILPHRRQHRIRHCPGGFQ